MPWEDNSTEIVWHGLKRAYVWFHVMIVQYSDDHLNPHMGLALFSYVHCKGASKARMLATLLSRDERDQLQPWL